MNGTSAREGDEPAAATATAAFARPEVASGARSKFVAAAAGSGAAGSGTAGSGTAGSGTAGSGAADYYSAEYETGAFDTEGYDPVEDTEEDMLGIGEPEVVPFRPRPDLAAYLDAGPELDDMDDAGDADEQNDDLADHPGASYTRRNRIARGYLPRLSRTKRPGAVPGA